jgi:hypothetical protein
VSEQDDPDVIEQAPRHASFPGLPWLTAGKWTPAGKRPGALTAAVIACVLLAAAGTFAALRLTSSGPADPDLGRLITEVTTVPVDTAAPAGFIAGAAGLPATPPSGASGSASTVMTDPDVLQRLTAAEQAVFDKYDNHGSTPFIDFADQAVQTGSGLLANLVAGNTWQQLAADLRHPETLEGATLLNEADTLTAELCSLTGGRPAAACPQPPGPAPPGR